MKSIWVVIPAHNEAGYIERVLQKVKKQTTNIIVVDDGSSDDTTKLAKRHIDHVLTHETNLGKGSAMKTGAQYAFGTLKADAVVFLDADDQHDPTELPRFFQALGSADFVFGVRRMGATMPLFRFLGNKFASVWLNWLFGAYIPDIPSGYKAMTKRAYQQLKWRSRGYEVEAEIAALVAKDKIPFTILEIESIYHDNDKGVSLLDAMHVAGCLFLWRVGI